jgi:DNA helicase-2/ATP-dependent DNA helicase PcrA
MALNPRQLEAVQHHDGALLILAGAGSGKTRVLVQRIAQLLEDRRAEPWQILAVTFTNKAARELVERCRAEVGVAAGELWAGTFHGISARLLRRHGDVLGYSSSFSIFDMDDQIRLLKELVISAGLDDSVFRPEAVRGYIDAAKNEARHPDAAIAAASDPFTMECAKIYSRYQERLKKMDAMDFGDLITNALALLEQYPEVGDRYRERFRYVMVDEYQDTNHAQYRMIHSIAAGHRNLCVVGDDDQSIYAWRGADRRNILEFERDWPGAHTVRLEENYRSTRNIIEAAAALIGNNSLRHEKQMFTANPAGEKIIVYTAADERDEARYIGDEIEALGQQRGDAAVFYRTNAQSRAVEEEMVRRGMPYVIVGATRFYERREIRDMLAYLRFMNNPVDDLALERIINVPARGIGKVSWQRVRAFAEQKGQSVFQVLGDEQVLASIAGAGRKRLKAFHEMATAWFVDPPTSVAAIARTLIEDTGYIAWLEGKPEDDAVGRIENVQEFVNVAASWDDEFSDVQAERDPEDAVLTPLVGFLERVALAADVDAYQTRERAVTLMTVHNSKGLEFPYVFVAGMEEGIFPHARSSNDEEGEGVEEERRLCYVAMTRAKRRLTLTHARRRYVFGNTQFNFSSRFLDEIPDALVSTRRSRREEGIPSAYGRGSAGGSARNTDGWDDPGPQNPIAKASTENSPGSFQPGMKVVHPMFGVGTVRRSDGTGESEKLVVQFQRVGLKKLMAKFARLEVV